MKSKGPKEVVVARMSTRQAVVVAVMSLFSAVAVASITDLDKLAGVNDEVSKELGCYEARAGNVERAPRGAEEELRARGGSARRGGRPEEAGGLAALADEVRAGHKRFLERHASHLEAIKSGKRLGAGEIRTEANEMIAQLNITLSMYGVGEVYPSAPRVCHDSGE